MNAPEWISDGLYRVRDGVVNWYLLTEQDEVTLIDAGWPRSWPRIERALEEMGRPVASVSSVVLTHGHPDHLGAAERVRQRCGATVYAHAPELARVSGRAKGASPVALLPALIPRLWRPSALGFVIDATARGFMTPTWVEQPTSFECGETLDVPGRPRAISTPGHTAGHASLLLEESGILLTGDAFATFDVLTHEHGPRLMPDALNEDTSTVRNSLEQLADVPARILLPGHGDPYFGPPARAIEQARSREALNGDRRTGPRPRQGSNRRGFSDSPARAPHG